jgi:hypothetical protein
MRAHGTPHHRRGVREALEGHRARIHDLVGHAEQVHAAVVHVTAEVDLPAVQHLLDQHVIRTDAVLRKLLDRLVVRPDQAPPDDVLFPGREAQVLDQLLGRIEAPDSTSTGAGGAIT